MRLFELFIQPSEWEWTTPPSEDNVVTRAEFQVGDTSYMMNIYKRGNHPVEIEFFTDDGYQHIIGSGGAFRVFATVGDILASYVKQMAPSAFYFTADKEEPSRVKMYDRLPRILKMRLPEYDFNRDDVGGWVKYTFRKGQREISQRARATIA